jgi:hypothetical protein
MAYHFAVVHNQGHERRVIQQETTFICNRCAEARLRRRASLVLLTGVSVGLLVKALSGPILWRATVVPCWPSG